MQAALCGRSLGAQVEKGFHYQPVCKMRRLLYFSSNAILNTIKTQRTKAIMGFGFFICIHG